MIARYMTSSVALTLMAATLTASAQVITGVDCRPNTGGVAALVRVAPTPLLDGVEAYVDRTHVYWNVPPALAGAEYILMANEDKVDPYHELHVTLAKAATLYLIIDNRIGTDTREPAISPDPAAAGMFWVAETGFVDTGMKMGLDEHGDGTVNNYYSVFSKDAPPGVIVLGAQNDASFGNPYDRNMYGVAAMARSSAGTAGLVGWWKLDRIESGLVMDSSGWGNHGVVLGNPQAGAGHFGGAVSFDGLDDSIDCGSDASLTSMDSVSVAAWIKRGALGSERTIASNHDGVVGGYGLGVYDDRVEFEIRTVGNAPTLNRGVPGGTVLAQDVWYHVVGIYDKGHAIRTYVNGALDRQLETSEFVGLSGGPLLLGRDPLGEESWWLGLLDDVRVYRRALTADEIDGIMQGEPLNAWNPQPEEDATVELPDATTLIWSAGGNAAMHDVYFGTDQDAVGSADPTSPLYRGRQFNTRFSLNGLVEIGNQYFWRIDEVADDGTTIYRGTVWAFAVPDYVIIDDFESYTGEQGNRLFDVWIDGSTNNTGSQVGRWINPFTGQTSGAGGRWSMFLAYDNTRVPFISEVEREFASEQDWTAGAGDTLSLSYRGDIVSFEETAPGTFTMSATGADIWGAGDQFRYVYKRLDGDGAIVAKVQRVGRTDVWAKAGVMIRQSLDPASAHAFMLVTPDGLRAFQNRSVDYSATCLSAHSWQAMSIPSWVKLERKGHQFTGYHSVNGIDWIQQSETDHTGPDPSPNPQTIPMSAYVYVGLALTSHASGAVTTATFSGVEITGEVIGDWQMAEIGVEQPGNSPEDLYVGVEDSIGETAMAIHPDPGAVNATEWTEWQIPLSDLGGVNLREVRRLYIGVGAPDVPLPGGTGRVYIDDIRLWKGGAGTSAGVSGLGHSKTSLTFDKPGED